METMYNKLELDTAIKLAPNQGVLDKRKEISDALRDYEENIISIVGPCPLVDEIEIITEEAEIKADLGIEYPKMISLDRQCFTKPRTNPADWQGLDSSDRPAAHRIIHKLSSNNANVAAEIRTIENLELYASKLSMAWTGGRNVENTDLMHLLATYDETIPIGIKNGLDGSIDKALEQVNYVNSLRSEDAAPAVLIYRGGENAKDIKSSEEYYKYAHQVTEGMIIRDNAHGIEMAYHPDKNFKKSIEGQVLASEAAVELARQGYAPAGVMYEASSLESIMDPHMPLEIALNAIKKLYHTKFGKISKSVV